MLLTKKSLWKIIIMPVCYFILGTLCIALAIIDACLQTNLPIPILYLGTFMYLACPLIVLWGRYAEGKAKPIALGLKLVRKELKPAEFIKQYNDLRASDGLIVNRPSLELLQHVVIAYESLRDKENVLATADEMLAVASEKKKTWAKLAKASYLYSYGMTEQAEELFSEARNQKQDFMSQALTDAILKSDRAMALGDYATVESYNLQLLERKFPKPDNLSLLVIHHTLGEVYEKTQKTEKAIEHYRYCASNGGETALRETAKAALERLQAE